MYLTPSNGAVWKSWPDFSSWNREELVDSRPDSESLRTRQSCYPARKMKVEKRKFDQALTKDAEGQAGASPRNLCQV